MRGADSYNESLFSTIRLEAFVPADHPLRPIRAWFNEALTGLDAKFSAMYERDVKGWRSRTRCGITRCSARTATG